MIPDEKNMSPEEKKRYLEKLRKQLDPEILKKMAGHMGGASVSDEGSSSSVSSSGVSGKFSTPADRIKERKAMQFQERVSQRKRVMEMQNTEINKEEPKIEQKALIYSSTEIWTRIVENQLKSIGFTETKSFYEFQSLLRFLIECYNKKCLDKIIIAVALKETKGFVFSWTKLIQQQESEKKLEFLKMVPFIMIVESQKQIPDDYWQLLNHDHILSLTDDVDMNKEKMERLILSFKENNL